MNPVGEARPISPTPTFLGGAGEDQGNGIAVDAAGNAYVTGETANVAPDPNYPTTLGALTRPTAGPATTASSPSSIQQERGRRISPTRPSSAVPSTTLGKRSHSAPVERPMSPVSRSQRISRRPRGTLGRSTPATTAAFLTPSSPASTLWARCCPARAFSAAPGATSAGGPSQSTRWGRRACTGETDSDPFPTTAARIDTTANGTSDVFVAKIVSDTTPPDSTITAGPAAGAEIGDDTPTFEFSSAEDGSSFQCRIDDSPFGPCSGPGQSHTPAGALATGPHSFEVIATDRAGNTDPTPATRDFTILAPIIVCCSPPDPEVPDTDPPETKITRAPGAVVGRHRARFEFSSDEPGSTFECKLDRRDYKPCGSPRRMRGLDDGRHGFRVRATDPSGNVDPTPARSRWKITD